MALSRSRTSRIALVGLAMAAVAGVAALLWVARSPAPLPPERAMPPLSPSLQKLQDFYKFRFLPDGYPGKFVDGSVTAPPIYGTYVISDYVRQYLDTSDTRFREGALTVAHATIARMEHYKEALVFWYPEEMRISRQAAKHYSGLTQAYYAVSFYRTFLATGDETLREASEQAFRSLSIPFEEGGVYYAWGDNVALAEVPTTPRDLILNGWLSILASVHDYADLTGSGEAHALFDRSSATVARLLPLFDAPDLQNSRYNLTGPLSVRLEITGSTAGVRIAGLRVDIPQEGTFDVPVRKGTRWEYWINPDTATAVDGGARPTKSKVSANLVLSRVSFPEENVVRFAMDTPHPLTITLAARIGRYSPLASEQVDETWQPIQAIQVPAGTTEVAVPLPWDKVDLVAYPTNFLKKIDGKNTDVYHAIHISRLRQLADWTDNPEFTRWADRWEGYVCDWATNPTYDGLWIRDYRVDTTDLVVSPASFCR